MQSDIFKKKIASLYKELEVVEEKFSNLQTEERENGGSNSFANISFCKTDGEVQVTIIGNAALSLEGWEEFVKLVNDVDIKIQKGAA